MDFKKIGFLQDEQGFQTSVIFEILEWFQPKGEHKKGLQPKGGEVAARKMRLCEGVRGIGTLMSHTEATPVPTCGNALLCLIFFGFWIPDGPAPRAPPCRFYLQLYILYKEYLITDSVSRLNPFLNGIAWHKPCKLNRMQQKIRIQRALRLFSPCLGLAALLTLSAGCGPLSNEEIKNLEDRLNPGGSNPNRTVVPVLSSIQYDSTGSEDLQYVISFNPALRLMNIRVLRRNTSALSTLISLDRSQQRDLYDILVLAFEGKSTPTDSLSCVECTKKSSFQLYKLNGAITKYLHPTWIASVPNSTSSLDVIDNLNRFILNRL